MTIEGRPNIQSDAYWKTQFEKQRKDRLQDSIDEYLQDDEIDPRRAYEEILSCVEDVINYHKKQLNKAVSLKSLMMGHRAVDLIDDPELAEKWKYDIIPDRY